MPTLRSVSRAALAAILLTPALGHAEKADRYKPVNIEADQGSTIDLAKQVTVFRGNVVVTKGTITIRAARIEVRQSPDGYYSAVAYGSPAQHATYRQKRDLPDEWIEGDAERLDYEGKTDIVRFVTAATVKRLHGSTVADEITGNLVTYDSTTEVFNVSGGAPVTAANPGGRVRAVLMPREGTVAAAEAASAAASGARLLRTVPALAAPGSK